GPLVSASWEGRALGLVDRARRHGPEMALAGIVALGAAVYGARAHLVAMPLVTPDELRYTLAARAVADGEWLNLREHGYGYGAVYPLVLAPIIALSGGGAGPAAVFTLRS